MNTEQIRLLLDASDALQDACKYCFEQITANSCTDRRNWSHEQKCRYASEHDYELSLKLIDLANSPEIESNCK